MTAILNQAITTAVTAQVGSLFQFRGGAGGQGNGVNAAIQGTFTYGSGGTTADAWVQTSFDGGTTWCDVANFHFTTANARFLFNLLASTSVTTQATPTDGTLAANTSVGGLIGNLWRVKYTTTGTYVGTTLRVDVGGLGTGIVPVGGQAG
jgi:hypothetical protein